MAVVTARDAFAALVDVDLLHDERIIVAGTPVEAQHGAYEIEFDR